MSRRGSVHHRNGSRSTSTRGRGTGGGEPANAGAGGGFVAREERGVAWVDDREGYDLPGRPPPVTGPKRGGREPHDEDRRRPDQGVTDRVSESGADRCRAVGGRLDVGVDVRAVQDRVAGPRSGRVHRAAVCRDVRVLRRRRGEGDGPGEAATRGSSPARGLRADRLFLFQMGFVLGLDRTSALASAILISTHPIFSVIVMWVTRSERPNRNQIAGVVLGFVGVAVFLRAWDAFAAARLGDLLSLGAAAAFGAYGVINQSLSARYPARELMSYTLGFGGLLVTLGSLPAMVDQDWGRVSMQSWVILAYAIVGPVYLAYALWSWAIRHRGIPRTVVYGFLVPVLGGVIAVVALDEGVRPEQVFGGLLVLAGLLVTRVGRDEKSSPH